MDLKKPKAKVLRKDKIIRLPYFKTYKANIRGGGGEGCKLRRVDQ